jgi:hypothetical protein
MVVSARNKTKSALRRGILLVYISSGQTRPHFPKTQDNTMSETELEVAEVKPLSPLQVFCAKVAIVAAAVLLLLYCTTYLFAAFITSQTEQLQVLKGGPAFWETVEKKLYTLADAPDLPAEKKKKIVDALRQLSSKYKPYFDALNRTAD